MANVVLDTSALLALVWGEAGSAKVGEVLANSHLSAVNLSEAVAKMVERDLADATIAETLAQLGCTIEPVDESAALGAGFLRRSTRARGLSLGDRICIDLARRLGLPVYTADRAWSELDLGVEVVLIR